MLDKAVLSIFSVYAKLQNSIYGGHLEFQNGRPWKLHFMANRARDHKKGQFCVAKYVLACMDYSE